ncbi:hypothetical protein LOTGIDRAFT_224684 [Lottia gigantea]|uniref:Lipoxygenase domain-containing protein n=1 Tax=Lottia gigantea TaxID=225164 RepID=V4B5C5_LOTGI|nr:hypothetical protein LOTGIDRAFT_224684 [Lottia gigantea]ESP02741.1 hypothetical protein LOTGIDRAFT_224684 [Lottia gigantea]
MGSGCSQPDSDYIIYVVTGDKKNSGTDAKVKIILHDENEQQSEEIKLDNKWSDDFESGKEDVFHVPHKQSAMLHGSISKIEFWRDDDGIRSDWFVNIISVKCCKSKEIYIFPVFKWIKALQHYRIIHLDTSLPQLDEHWKQRQFEMEEIKDVYEYGQKQPGMPVQIKNIPDDEQFSFDYLWDIVVTKSKLIAKSKLSALTAGRWKCLEDFKKLFDKNILPLPKAANTWKDDVHFGRQRLTGCNHSLIKLCTVIPDKLTVTDEMLNPILEGNSLQYLLDNNRIFICDFNVLEKAESKEGYCVCAPIALFMIDKNQDLRPIAIQLYQDPDPDNPIFLPSDDPNLWNLAKMWFNNADAAHHQSQTHLGFTHLLMEGVCIAVHRCLSQSHPLFKLLAPHFLFLIAINTRGLDVLISEGGWVDKVMNIGAKGMFKLIEKGLDEWRIDLHGTLPNDFKSRGVLNQDILPGYHFRDDSLLLYHAIQKYVENYVSLYYDSEDKITGDWELQNLGKELSMPKSQGGVGVLGVPNDGELKTKEDISLLFTSVIVTCSVMHCATNFPIYQNYAFPPNYPATMRGVPPSTKDPIREDFIMDSLPNKSITRDILVVSKILSLQGTKSLGDFEVQYIYDPSALKIVEEFRSDLRKISLEIKERNKTRKTPYTNLDPEYIPNSISI